MKNKHTPGEWKVLFGQYPIGTLSINQVATNKRICALEFKDCKAKEETEANAAHIVKCVNAHDELKNCLQAFVYLIETYNMKKDFPGAYMDAKEVLKKVSDTKPIEQ